MRALGQLSCGADLNVPRLPEATALSQLCLLALNCEDMWKVQPSLRGGREGNSLARSSCPLCPKLLLVTIALGLEKSTQMAEHFGEGPGGRCPFQNSKELRLTPCNSLLGGERPLWRGREWQADPSVRPCLLHV